MSAGVDLDKVEALESVVVTRLTGVQCAVVIGGRHGLIADEPKEIGGTDTGPNPFSLLLTALGVWTVGTLTGLAQRQGIPLTGVEVRLTRKLNQWSDGPGDPREFSLRIARIRRDIRLRGPLTEEHRAALSDAACHCPVANTLAGGPKVEDSVTVEP